MTRTIRSFIIFTAFVSAVFAITPQPRTTAAGLNLKAGAVYVLTNQPGNAVAQLRVLCTSVVN